MLRGINDKKGFSEELIENVDLLPTLLSFSNIPYEKKKIDGNLPSTLGGKERKFIFSESIYPNQSYKATLKDKTHELYIESVDKTTDSGGYSLNKAKYSLYDKDTCELITNKYLKEKYFSYLSNYNIWRRKF